MGRFPNLAALLLTAAALHADPPTVADLVKQLGDPKFAVREVAQRELLKRGEGIVPELDRLTKGADAETADRIGKVRYRLVGYKADIRRLLVEVTSPLDSAPPPSADQLRGLIAGHQPGSGNLLLTILTNPKHELYRQAVLAFVANWDVATPDQIDAYLRQSLTLTTWHRSKFPAGVGALIPVKVDLRHGGAGWRQPYPRGFTFRTRTTRYVDGKPVDKPFEFPSPFGTVGWYRVGELAEGNHTIQAVLAYEFTHQGQMRTGEIRMKESSFEVLPADTPDDLILPKSEGLTKRVREVFRIVESGHDPKAFDGVRPGTLPAQGAKYHWYPNITWQPTPGVTAGVHCPIWWQTGLLTDVDLCFDATIHDVKTGNVYPASPVIINRAANANGNVVAPRNLQAFAKGRDGFMTIKVVLKPSRALALSDPDVKGYYPESITSDEMRMKVYQKVEVQP